MSSRTDPNTNNMSPAQTRRAQKRCFDKAYPTTSPPLTRTQGVRKKPKRTHDNEYETIQVKLEPEEDYGEEVKSPFNRGLPSRRQTVKREINRPSSGLGRTFVKREYPDEESAASSSEEEEVHEPRRSRRVSSSSNSRHSVTRARTGRVSEAKARPRLKRTRGGVNLHVCVECEYTSTYKSHLTAHMRTHTGVKPFACDECEYTSATKSDLTRHMRTHTGVKPYACDECEYTCAQKSHLTVHMRTHT